MARCRLNGVYTIAAVGSCGQLQQVIELYDAQSTAEANTKEATVRSLTLLKDRVSQAAHVSMPELCPLPLAALRCS